jgi:predicted nucleic acid-binding protein
LILLDTSVAIPIRDMEARILAVAETWWPNPMISIITRIELEGGVTRPGSDPRRRDLLATFLNSVTVLELTDAEARAYRAIVEQVGFSRRKLLDRLIAATALVHKLPLATLNPGDFADVPGLEVVDWSEGGAH